MQNQALAALLFLYREVLRRDLPWLDDLVRAKRPAHIPVVLTRDEVRLVLSHMQGTPRLMATLLYGSGLRLLECCRLRVKDVDFGRHQIVVRSGKGDKDRVTMLPASVRSALATQLDRARDQHQRDLAREAGWVELPAALAQKLPAAGRDCAWQWVFPATRHYVDRKTGQQRRHHLHETVVQQAVRQGVLASGIAKRASCHTLRHSFATHLFEDGTDIRTLQEHVPVTGDDDDLHARPEPRAGWGTESGRSVTRMSRPGHGRPVLGWERMGEDGSDPRFPGRDTQVCLTRGRDRSCLNNVF